MTGSDIAIVAALGAVGALLRWGLTAWVTNYPRALMVVAVNSLGSFGAGIGIGADWGLWASLLAAGLWGSLTTLSTLAVDVVERAVGAGWQPAALLLSLHVIGGGVGVLGGVWLGGQL